MTATSSKRRSTRVAASSCRRSAWSHASRPRWRGDQVGCPRQACGPETPGGIRATVASCPSSTDAHELTLTDTELFDLAIGAAEHRLAEDQVDSTIRASLITGGAPQQAFFLTGGPPQRSNLDFSDR